MTASLDLITQLKSALKRWGCPPEVMDTTTELLAHDIATNQRTAAEVSILEICPQAPTGKPLQNVISQWAATA